MAITRQAYEWRGVVTTGTTVCRTGHPVLGDWTAADGTAGGPTTAYNNTISVPAFEGGMPLDIMWGGKGNNLRTSATTKENQLLILDGLACWPTDSNINVYVDDTYYFEAPDYSSISGLTGNMVPFPEPNADNIFTHEAFREGIYPPLVIDGGSTWGVFWNKDNDNSVFVPTADSQVPRAFVRYYLVDGSDYLIAKQLMKLNFPLTLRNFTKYKQDVLRWNNMADSHVFRLKRRGGRMRQLLYHWIFEPTAFDTTPSTNFATQNWPRAKEPFSLFTSSYGSAGKVPLPRSRSG